MDTTYTHIFVTPQNTVIFEAPNDLVAPRREIKLFVNQVVPEGNAFIRKGLNSSGNIHLVYNGADIVFNVAPILQVGNNLFKDLGIDATTEDIERKTILVYNSLVEIFMGCCPCGEGGGSSDTRIYQLGGVTCSSLGRTSYTSFLGNIISPTVETNVLATFNETCLVRSLNIWLDNSCSEESQIVVRKNGVDTAHIITVPANTGGYFSLQGMNELYSSTDTFSIRATIPDTATGELTTSLAQGAYMVVQVGTTAPFGTNNNLNSITDPTINDDSSLGYINGTNASVWFNTLTGVFWVCADPTIGAAVWTPMGAGVPTVFVDITREDLIALEASGGVEQVFYRVSECLVDVSDSSIIYVAGIPDVSENTISIWAWNGTTNEFGQYNIGTTGNNDDTFTPQGDGSLPVEHQVKGIREDDNVSGAYALDCDAYSLWMLTLTGNTTLSFSNLASGNKSQVIELVVTGSYSLTLPAWVKARSMNRTYDGSKQNQIVISIHNGNTGSEAAAYSLDYINP